jgi:GNAT superfamily N-acetyltransferase
VDAVQVERHADATSFLERTGDFLLEREAQHNLILGLAGRLRREPLFYGEDPYFAVALDGDRVAGAAMRTPPHNLILSEIDDVGALEPIADDVQDVYESISGVIGAREAAALFARSWGRRTGAEARIGIRQRIYRAAEARLPGGVSGEMRRYREGDRALVLEWMGAFVAEALPEAPPETPEEWLERNLTNPDGGLDLWVDDGQPVSFAAYGGLTPNGIRIGPVYTPPELRRRGHATALVAEVTRMLLERGRRFCFLFTDLANPTSNSIYQRVGYRPVTDVDQWTFASS